MAADAPLVGGPGDRSGGVDNSFLDLCGASLHAMRIVKRLGAKQRQAIQFMIENQYAGKKPLPKPEQFVDLSIVDQLEKSGFIDSLNK